MAPSFATIEDHGRTARSPPDGDLQSWDRWDLGGASAFEACRCGALHDGGWRGRHLSARSALVCRHDRRAQICTRATVEVLARDWDGSIPFANTMPHRSWHHVTGFDSLLNIHVGRNTLFWP